MLQWKLHIIIVENMSRILWHNIHILISLFVLESKSLLVGAFMKRIPYGFLKAHTIMTKKSHLLNFSHKALQVSECSWCFSCFILPHIYFSVNQQQLLSWWISSFLAHVPLKQGCQCFQFQWLYSSHQHHLFRETLSAYLSTPTSWPVLSIQICSS